MPKNTYQKLIERAALTALELHQISTQKKALKAELSSMYDTFFAAHGRPEGRFDPESDAFLPVMNFTESQFQRVQTAKKAEYNAKRRHETAIRALAAHSKEVA
ncbi:hypothetical protein QU617_09820 [Pseudomonas guariconensis]|uniref:hypothetical protein n=1 Tax=Pseudomonas guariconensis TaxID=1288410 RepID=UPI0025A95CBE|nr:hypothetical protein [Pseudomonas guariconensis]MDM9593607.1 hypothetical protein [Pseudomonas guariconensis]MDM9606434.1 hypothetical protein [Pseudomonas guariconensis]MDM9611390.1 hypothetical protein [Pseudomonas guariconensis]